MGRRKRGEELQMRFHAHSGQARVRIIGEVIYLRLCFHRGQGSRRRRPNVVGPTLAKITARTAGAIVHPTASEGRIRSLLKTGAPRILPQIVRENPRA